ncbi:hypothetical protein Pth03_36730 [Planotetraspora thailandica]|uniref:CoxE n=1 Tax=Planotetraspora thailandica TaxID=487172 RepID=A0A8J3V067_9ACTN|nr:VWA domain-containing protein [Planotetraspora thailandica]GII55284.1 hypothetical protein Pth03_36730 [Planotetraspora thailandica]
MISASPSREPAAFLPGVDRAALAVAFADRLRRRGMPVGLTAVQDVVRALEADPPTSLSRLYWAARIGFVRRHAEIEIFDEVFAAVFRGVAVAADPNARRRPGGGGGAPSPTGPRLPAPSREDRGALPWATLPQVVAGAADSAASPAVPERLPGDVSGLADVPFEHLDGRSMELLGEWLRAAVAAWPVRRGRRFAVGPRGRRPALRATLARSRRTGWEPFHLMRERPLDRPRRTVMLCDVSQSMQAEATAYLHMMRALALVAGAEVFAFATSLTRLTPALTHRSAADAVDHATAKVADRFGGTRIAANVHTLLASHHGGTLRGAIVIIGSDGWDSDPPDALAAAMARLRRRANRVIWMNPRASAPGFEPSAGGMAAALPYCDELLPADTFASLRRVIDAIARTRSSSTG